MAKPLECASGLHYTIPVIRRSLLLALSLVAHPALAEDTAAPIKVPVPHEPSFLGAATAIFPGIVLHGFGHYVAGQTTTAKNLLKWQGIGMGMVLTSATWLRLSGGSRYGNEVSIPLLVSGIGIFLNTFWADLYGNTIKNEAKYSRPAKASATLGYAWIYDPQFAYDHFAVVQGRVEVATFDPGVLSIAPSIWIAATANNQRGRIPAELSIWENSAGEHLFVGTALGFHHFGAEGFTKYVAELSAGGRFSMERLGATLRGSFSSASIGYGMEVTFYSSESISSEVNGLLLGHFGYGLYLPYNGEIEFYYEHRRDDFAAGISPSSRNGSGFLGHFGSRWQQPLSKTFALDAQVEFGAAWLIHSGLRVTF